MTHIGNVKTIGFGIAVAFTSMTTELSAQEVLKWGHVYETATPYHAAAVAAGEAFEEATQGRYTIEVFPASQLGKEVAQSILFIPVWHFWGSRTHQSPYPTIRLSWRASTIGKPTVSPIYLRKCLRNMRT